MTDTGDSSVPTVPAVPRVVTVLTTTDSAARADALARGAVDRKLAACAQISAPVTSVYRWQDEVTTDQEWQVLLKTAGTCYEALEAYIRQVHDYDTPEIIATPVVQGSEDYLAWVIDECKGSG